MLTLKAVNKAIKAIGLDCELHQGEGYLYFSGPDVEWANSTSIPVCRLNHIPTIQQWVENARSVAFESAKRKPE